MKRTPPMRSRMLLALAALVPSATGCSVFDRVDAVPAHRLPDRFRARPKSEMVDLSLRHLQQAPPEVYRLGPGDVLGIYIENVLGEPDEAPPVHFAEQGDRAHAIGFPIPVREDGTVSLPYVDPIDLEGRTLAEAAEIIRRNYVDDHEILPEYRDRIIVTLHERRSEHVLVIREESGLQEGVTKRGTGYAIDLDAYENDILHALTETGGTPGVDVRNEIVVLRQAGHHYPEERDGVLDTHVIALDGIHGNEVLEPGSVRIPLRFYPEQPPVLQQDDILLHTGDIVLIRARDNEVFYTGGVLGGGRHPLPRDADLDVLQAVALARGPVGTAGSGIGSIGGGPFGGAGTGFGGGGVPPSIAIVLRQLPNGKRLPIRVDLKEALTDHRQRLLIQPEDTIIVRYTLGEEILNTTLGLLRFNFLLGNGVF